MNKKMIKELLKAHCTIENGRWIFKQVDIDAASLELEQAISAKPIVSRSKCDFHAAFTFCGDNGITYCSNCGDPV